MKKISEHLGEIIVAMAGVALIIAACVVFRAPIGNFFNSIISTENNIAQDVLGDIRVGDLTIANRSETSLFSKFNLVPGGDFEDENHLFYANIPENANGEPAITTEAYNTTNHSLKCFGNTTQNRKITLKFMAGDYYVACRVRVDRYVQGNAGFTIDTSGVGVTNIACISETTDNEFVTVSAIYTSNSNEELPCYIGSIASADLDCYIDDVVVVPLSAFETSLTKEELDDLYESHLLSQNNNTSLDTECVSAFMSVVNQKASDLEMNDSYFSHPAGLGDDSINYTTARDMAKLMVAASRNTTINQIWSQKTKEIQINGLYPRVETLVSTVQQEALTDYYPILGGKTGSWTPSNAFNLGTIVEINGKTVVGVVLNAVSAENRFSAMKELLDISTNIMADENYDSSTDAVTLANSAIACIITEEGYEVLFEQNADMKIAPASLTKVLTMLTALDYVEDLEQTILIQTSDILRGTGNIFIPGDIITFEEAFYAMMLPSSNTAAAAVARTLGK